MVMILSGLAEQEKLQKFLLQGTQQIKNLTGETPKLGIILIGNSSPSLLYVQKKQIFAKTVGLQIEVFHLQPNISLEEILSLIHRLNKDSSFDGILLQLPTPPHIDAMKVIEAIDPSKDVDGLHPMNAGKLVQNQPGLYPCTPQGCMHLISLWKKDLQGLTSVVVGRSLLVGKPMAALLLKANTTVIQVHSQTKDLEDFTRLGDILVVAVGNPGMIRESFVKEGACVIDVGISKNDKEQTVGDVVFDEVKNKAAAISPVPNGVGPMTISYLALNVLKSYCLSRKISWETIMGPYAF